MTARKLLTASLLGTTMLTALPSLTHAQTAADAGAQQPDEVIVTAQKRSERLQSVPISIEVLTTKKLDQLNIANINDYVAQLPSVIFQNSPYQGSSVYFRGVASGGDGNHSGSEPSAGVYLDEQPVTTIGGPLDVHIYDVARIESLAGPQGTLYGASSEAGTVRIITNKPDGSSAYGRFDADLNGVDHGGTGHKLEGMYNLPLGDRVALRVVGWDERDAGYIDNVAGTRTFLGQPDGEDGYLPGLTINNSAYVKKNYNTTDIDGGRAALKVDLDDNWTATASLFGQDKTSKGSAGYDPSLGDLKVQHFFPEFNKDKFWQAALTVQGKIGDLDLTYAGAYMDRKINMQADYTDYAEAYDQMYSSIGGLASHYDGYNHYYFNYVDNNGNDIPGTQTIKGYDHFTKTSHELRLASPSEGRFRWVAGLFYERQFHYINQDYQIPGLADVMSVNGHPGTLWLTSQNRVDEDSAAFGEASFDITPALTLTAGLRTFKYDNSLIGFFGFGENQAYRDGLDPPSAAYGDPYTLPNAVFGSSGVRRCLTTDTYGAVNPKDPTGTLLPAAIAGTPCTDLGVQNADGTISPKRATGNGTIYKLNLSWKASPDLMVYGTVSKGFRPGGINRRSTVEDYEPDYLVNYELGWKATLAGGTLRLNGAVYHQDWNSFQFSFLGPNSFTEIHNGPDAAIDGLEADLTWSPITHLNLTASGAFTDARTKSDLCTYQSDPEPDCSGKATLVETTYGSEGPDVNTTHPQDFVAAPKGTRLPVTPRVKLAGTARYAWTAGDYKPYVQAVVAYQSSASTDLRTAISQTYTGTILNPAALQGDLPAFTTVDLALGADYKTWTIEFYIRNAGDERAQVSRYEECGMCQQRPYAVVMTPRTFGIRLGSKF